MPTISLRWEMTIILKFESLTKNYIYNTLFTVCNMIFPIVTFPYASRILGAAGIGLVTFVLSIVTYFTTFASLGIPNYGIREIAKYRDNQKQVSKVYSEIFTINFLATIVCIAIYYLMVLTFSVFHENCLLYSVIGLSIVLNLFNVDWMYKGFENYTYITKRSIAFKLLSLAILFLFVHNTSDYIIYGFVQVVAISGSNIINVFTAKKYVQLTLKGLNLRKHLCSIMVLFSSVIIINIYTNMDSTMLGIISGEKYVGYYAAANKINGVMIGIVTSLGVVLYPRLSYYIKHDLRKEFDLFILKSVRVVIMVSIPVCIGLLILAPQVINILSGTGFAPAITTMRIQVIIILFVGISNLTGIQILLPLGKEKNFLVSVLSGGCVDFLLNLFLIPHFQQNGAALSSTIAELFVAVVQIYYTRRYMKGKILNKQNVHYIIASAIMSLCVFGIVTIKMGNILTLLVGTVVGTIVYMLFNVFFRDSILLEMIDKALRRS